MNNRVSRMLGVCLLTGLSVGMGASSASAQMVESVRVTLPQQISVGDVTLPAGKYTVREVSNNGAAPVLLFHSEAGMNAAVIVEPINAPRPAGMPETKLVLRSVGEGLQLDKIWIAGQGMGYQVVSLAE